MNKPQISAVKRHLSCPEDGKKEETRFVLHFTLLASSVGCPCCACALSPTPARRSTLCHLCPFRVTPRSPLRVLLAYTDSHPVTWAPRPP